MADVSTAATVMDMEPSEDMHRAQQVAKLAIADGESYLLVAAALNTILTKRPAADSSRMAREILDIIKGKVALDSPRSPQGRRGE